MDIVSTIAANLSAWMADNPDLDTIKKVAARSGVGFGTVRRTKNGEGNPTITNLADIARAFKRPLEDLLRPVVYATPTANITPLRAAEPTPIDPLRAELLALLETMSERGIIELIGRAKEVALAHPRAKANRRN